MIELNIGKYFEYANDMDCGLTLIQNNQNNSLEIVVQHMPSESSIAKRISCLGIETARFDLVMETVKDLCDKLVEKYNEQENEQWKI